MKPGSPQSGSYDDFAAHYHLIFQDWETAILWEANVLGPLLEKELAAPRLRILDCACGIGTQTLGLAARGHALVATDISRASVERARREAAGRALPITLHVADMRALAALEESRFDAVIAVDNALPHLLNDRDLQDAAGAIASRLRPGGLFLASIRDYDAALLDRPAIQAPRFFLDNGRRRIVHQVWDWLDDRIYAFHLYITRQTETGWECLHHSGTYRAILRAELDGVLRKAGFSSLRWLMPGESGFYQPIVLARTA